MFPQLFPLMNLVMSATVIALATNLAKNKPSLAGFIIALPLSSMIAIAFSQLQFADSKATVQFAKSIFVSIPLSLTFFVPFLFADKLGWPLWGLYLSGVGLLAASYGVQRSFL